ncbi:MAG: glutaminyl-peptide cyclotransferase [Acidobacteriota bacterium]
MGPEATIQRLRPEIVAVYSHDPVHFTQGLLWDQGVVVESTGRYGYSKVVRWRLEDGAVLRSVNLPRDYFGEGITLAKGALVQLTWREGTAFFYDPASLRELRRTAYEGEGWGLTFDGTWLIMSDGSDVLTFRDPQTLAVWRRLPVRRGREPVRNLNELEYVEGFVYANVWQSREIMKIEAASGRVVAVIDGSVLPYRSRLPGEDVLNGIAWIPERRTFLLTGKLWPQIFEVRIPGAD